MALFQSSNLQSYFDILRLPNLASSMEYSVGLHSYSARVRLLHPRCSLCFYYITVASRCQEVFEIFSNFFLRESTLPCSLLNPCLLDNIIISHDVIKVNKNIAQNGILKYLKICVFFLLTNAELVWYNFAAPSRSPTKKELIAQLFTPSFPHNIHQRDQILQGKPFRLVLYKVRCFSLLSDTPQTSEKE